MNINGLLKYFSDTHYIHPIFFIFCILVFIISLKSKNKEASLNIFNYYFGAFIILNVVIYIAHLFPSTITVLLINYSDYFFTVFEYLVFAFYIGLKILNHAQKKYLFWIS